MSVQKGHFKMSSENPNTCLLCDVKCVSSDALDFHVKTVHLRLFVCTKCPDYTTMIHAKLVRHVANEHKEIPKVKNVILNVSKPKEVSKAKLIVIEVISLQVFGSESFLKDEFVKNSG